MYSVIPASERRSPLRKALGLKSRVFFCICGNIHYSNQLYFIRKIIGDGNTSHKRGGAMHISLAAIGLWILIGILLFLRYPINGYTKKSLKQWIIIYIFVTICLLVRNYLVYDSDHKKAGYSQFMSKWNQTVNQEKVKNEK